MAKAVGPTGQIIGVDPSEDMKQAAMDRCKEYEWVNILDGTAIRLPVQDQSVDKAVFVQVFEYLDDIPGACSEAYRIPKSGGRLVVGDIHLDGLICFSEKPERMKKMIAVWDHHFVERCVPAILPDIMRNTGFISVT